jgi:hypothetical protein
MQVKIIEFSAFNRGKGEERLEHLVNQGWQIVSAAGAGSMPFHGYMVILQREASAIPSQELDQLNY